MLNNCINIAFITDNNFVIQTIVALFSLRANKLKETEYNIVILGKELSNSNITQFEKLSESKFCVKVLPLNDAIISESICKNSIYSSNVLYKLKLEKIFTEYNKLLFLDSDIIVLDDLTELYNTSIDNYYIAGVKDIGAVVYNLKNKNKLCMNYFNTGVMLLNLKKIREENFFDNVILNYETNAKNYYFPEQDALNELIKDKIKLISIKYNFITSNVRYTTKQLTNFFKEDMDNIKPVVLHYAGRCRPWKYSNVFFAKEWLNYYKESPFKNEKLKNKYIPLINIYIKILYQIRIILNKSFYRNVGIIN